MILKNKNNEDTKICKKTLRCIIMNFEKIRDNRIFGEKGKDFVSTSIQSKLN